MGDRNLSHQNQTSHMFNGSNSVNNYTDHDNETFSELAYYMYGIVWPTISSLGVGGNFLSFLVLFQLSKSSSFYMYLASLALSDLAFLVVGGIFTSLEMGGVDQTSQSPAQNACSVSFAFTLLFSQFSSWITVTVTVDRLIAVCYPLTVSQYCNRTRALIHIAVTFLVLVAVDFPVICIQWDDEYSSCVLPEFTNDYCFKYINYIDMFVHVLIPFCIICILNIFIVRGIFTAARKRLDMTAANETSASSTTNVKDPTTRTATMLLTVTSFFIISFLPFVGVSLYAIASDQSWNDVLNLFPIAIAVVDMGILLNHSVNFILYGLSGRHFRERFVKTFCCRR